MLGVLGATVRNTWSWLWGSPTTEISTSEARGDSSDNLAPPPTLTLKPLELHSNPETTKSPVTGVKRKRIFDEDFDASLNEG
jgi:hypothetical protein